jgi:hypothetical protein
LRKSWGGTAAGWRRIERGERRVYVPEFIDIAIALKVDPTELFARVLLS